jgi:uncharacterized repeat protein (TIGR03803 family)
LVDQPKETTMERFPRLLKHLSLAAGFVLALGAQQASATPVFAIICSFAAGYCSSLGQNPSSGLVEDSAGNFYGTTHYTGANGGGTVFKMTPNPSHTVWTFQALFNFCPSSSCTDGSSASQGYEPNAGVIVDTNGNVYGTTTKGGPSGSSNAYNGTVYELVKPVNPWDPWTLNVLHGFCSTIVGTICTDGSNVQTGLSYAGQSSGAAYDGTSPLYGTTLDGGSDDRGTVYQLKLGSHWNEKVLHNFCAGGNCAVDVDPSSGVTLDANGKLYGVSGGAPNGKGVVYQLTPAAHGLWPETILYQFCPDGLPCVDGWGGNANVMFDGTGNLYGTTDLGGDNTNTPYGTGVVYKLVPGGCTYSTGFTGWCESVAYGFCHLTSCADGGTPSQGLAPVMDASGHLFGTTSDGGANGGGALYKLTGANLHNETVLHDFCATGGSSCTDGTNPVGGLMMDSSGIFYGTTFGGGSAGNDGIAFQLTP